MRKKLIIGSLSLIMAANAVFMPLNTKTDLYAAVSSAESSDLENVQEKELSESIPASENLPDDITEEENKAEDTTNENPSEDPSENDVPGEEEQEDKDQEEDQNEVKKEDQNEVKKEDQDEVKKEEQKTSEPKLTYRLTCSGHPLTFSQKVEKDNYLSGNIIPGKVMLKANKKSITLTWKKPSNYKKVDGYIIFRKKGSSGRFTEVGKVARTKTVFVDKKANRKNTLYTYCMVAYKKENTIQISNKTSDWVRGTTSRSKTANAYKVTIKNKADFNPLWAGNLKKIKLKFPSKTVSKTIRWTSSNENVAFVSKKGVVTARQSGSATIQIKLDTGYTKKLKVKIKKGGTASAMLKIMKSWISYSEKNRKHRKIIDIYNAYGRLPVGYRVGYGDAWCDTCISAAAIMSGNVNQIGRECGVIRHVDIFKKKGIWIENGSITPKPGYIIVYNWGKFGQPNNSGATHIGIVQSVSKGWITTIEGNYKDQVGTRRIRVGWGYIRGYARPKYKK